MLRAMIKLVSLIAISSIWLLSVILPEIQAQQTESPQSQAVQTRAVTIKELQSRHLAIESMTDIEASMKADSLDYIERATRYLELADNTTNKKTNARSQLIQTAPERMKILQAELKKPFTAPEKVEARARKMSTLKLEQRLTQKEAELSTAQNKLSQLERSFNGGESHHQSNTRKDCDRNRSASKKSKRSWTPYQTLTRQIYAITPGC